MINIILEVFGIKLISTEVTLSKLEPIPSSPSSSIVFCFRFVILVHQGSLPTQLRCLWSERILGWHLRYTMHCTFKNSKDESIKLHRCYSDERLESRCLFSDEFVLLSFFFRLLLLFVNVSDKNLLGIVANTKQ